VLLANGRVTVVIPTYNRAALVQRAIQSVLQQTASSLCDIVVVDDGSTDITPQVLQRYASKVRYLRQLNAGVAAARNAALRGPCNEFVAFLDSDDEWAPHKLARQLDVLRRYPEAVLVATHGVRRAAGGLEWAPELPPVPSGRPVDLVPHLFGGAFLLTSGVVVRANSLPQRGPFSTNLRMCEDYLLWLQLACRGPAIVLAERLVTCGWNAPASLAADVARVREAQLRARYLAQWELRRRPDCAAAWREGLARLLAGQRDVALRAGQPSLAARLGFRSLMASPRGRALWEWGRLGHALLGCLVPSRRYG
jgi:glycosyltransferase involved in cell wall biosynthesis